MKEHVRLIGRVVAVVARNPDLRRVQIAFSAFNGAEWAVWIAMLVYAYGRGGATAAGLVALVQMIPATLFAPFASVLGDRYRPARVLTLGYFIQATAMGATAAVLLLDGPAALAYACAAVAATATTMTRPTMAALTPGLCRTPEELTASNVVSGWNESTSILVAPALAGLILAVSGPGWVFLVMATAVLGGALLVATIAGPAANPASGASVRRELVEGFSVVVREPSARTLVGILGAEQVALGMLDVLYVVLAVSVLGMGNGGAGYLNAAFGLGGALAIAVTATLVGRARLIPAIVGALAAWAAAFILLALLSTVVAAMLLLVVAGAAHSLFDVSGRTLLQRTAPPEVLARVFGVLECLMSAGIAIGAMLAPLLVHLGGTTAADRRHRPAPAVAGAPDRPAPLRARCVGHGADRRDRAAAVAAAVLGALAAGSGGDRSEPRAPRGCGRDGDRDAGRGRATTTSPLPKESSRCSSTACASTRSAGATASVRLRSFTTARERRPLPP